MNVQIFIQEDNKALIYDNDQLDEFKSLVDELGLKCNNHIDSDRSPIPYMWLDVIGRVYKTQEQRSKDYHWSASTYLIGRWGAEAKEVSELVNDAVKIASDRIQVYSESTIAKLKSWKECPELWAKQYIFNNNSEASHAFNSGSTLPF